MMSESEFEKWCENKTPAEIELKIAELNAEQREAEQSKLDEARNAVAEEQAFVQEQKDIQSRFIQRHDEYLPNKLNGDLIRRVYLEQWEAANPGTKPVWDADALEAVYRQLRSQGVLELDHTVSSKPTEPEPEESEFSEDELYSLSMSDLEKLSNQQLARENPDAQAVEGRNATNSGPRDCSTLSPDWRPASLDNIPEE